MIGYELAVPIIAIITAILYIGVLLYQFNSRIGRKRTVRVIPSGEQCTPDPGSLPVIPQKECKNDKGEDVSCYQPDPSIDLVFEIGKDPVYFKSICSKLCKETASNGNCLDQSNEYEKCISILQPPSVCNSSANPVGRLNGTTDVYYAIGIIG